jgi:hypothetical protein
VRCGKKSEKSEVSQNKMKGEDPYRRNIEAMAMRRNKKRDKFKRQSRKARLEKREVAPFLPRSPPDDEEEEEAKATTDVNEYEDNDMDYASEINNDEPVYDDDDDMEDDTSSSPTKASIFINPQVIAFNDEEEEDYYWTNFISESRKVFATKKALMDFFEKNFPRVCHKINLGGSGFYLKKEHRGLLNNYVKVKELDKTCSFSYMVTNITPRYSLTTQQVTLPLGSVLEQSRDM